MSNFESPKDSGPDEARRQISIYSSELVAMAVAARYVCRPPIAKDRLSRTGCWVVTHLNDRNIALSR